MNIKKYALGFFSLSALLALFVAVPVLADSSTPVVGNPGNHLGETLGRMGRGMMVRPVIFGTVSAVNGNTITVSGRHSLSEDSTATTTYTIDATNAKITKNGSVSTIAGISVGDTIMADGTLTGTNLVASVIRDGQLAARLNNYEGNSVTPVITGNGEPVVAGTVSSISGSTITITNKSNVTYAVDATNAKIAQGQSTITVSNIAVGDSLVVQGTVNGNSVVASSIIDQTRPATSTTTTPVRVGFFGRIGTFFAHLFGF